MIAYAVSNTGPLISAFQANAVAVLGQVVGKIYLTPSCLEEICRHGWQKEAEAAIKRGFLEVCDLTEKEQEMAAELEKQITSKSRQKALGHHRGEAEALALASRATFSDYLVLIDEKAARAVARERNQKLSGFPGVLIRAAQQRIITPKQVKQILDECRRQGTRYAQSLVDFVYEKSREVYQDESQNRA